MTSTTSGNDTSLKSLRDRPFELLKELERRSRPVTSASSPEASGRPRMGGCGLPHGGETFLIAREETREVLGFPAVITRIPGAKSWVKGLANVRGSLLPMLDLKQFLGSGATTPAATRVSSWSTIAKFPQGSSSTKCLDFAVSQRRSSTLKRRRR